MKIVNITYGLKGEKPRKYSYLVNDNIRNGQVVFPNVKHYQSGKIYGTVGIVQNSYKADGKMGKEMVNEIEAQGKTLTGTIANKGGYNPMGSISNTQKGENGLYVGTENTINNYDAQKKDNPYIQEKKQEAANKRIGEGAEQEYETADDYLARYY